MLRFSMGGRKCRPRDHAGLVIFGRVQNDTRCSRCRARLKVCRRGDLNPHALSGTSPSS